MVDFEKAEPNSPTCQRDSILNDVVCVEENPQASAVSLSDLHLSRLLLLQVCVSMVMDVHLLLSVCVGVCVALNLDTSFPLLKKGGDGSLFGLSVALHRHLRTDSYL